MLYLEKYDDRIPGEKFSGCAIGMERDISDYHPKNRIRGSILSKLGLFTGGNP
ncbi:MAG: hypothetical protein PHH09_13045 [Methanoregulaceae archaeon]|nr:hypothetical protein [Methanoregulaceae archaeon]